MIGEMTCPAASSQPLNTSRGRILIVDDDPHQLSQLASGFRRLGFRTLTANTGRSGIYLAREHHPDAVVLEAALPDQDGLTVCQQLNDEAGTCDIPVIMVSWLARREAGQPDLIRSARSAGCRFFLGKPYDPNALLVLVEAAISLASGW